MSNELTPREKQIFAQLAKGLTNNGIARELDMPVDTVKAHVRAILRKLGVENRTQAALLWGM